MSVDPLSDPDVLRRLDDSLAAAAESVQAPGTQAVLIRRGEVVWSGCHGVADIATGEPVTDATTFCLASLGKTLVAATALRLVEQGRLGLDSPIADVLGDEVPGSHVVTARMLLSHTSGIPDLYDSPAVARLMQPDPDEPGSGSDFDPDRPFTWELLRPGFLDPVDPGVRWEYSNAGYIVLTEMLVRILGGSSGLSSAWQEMATSADARLGDDVLTWDRASVRHLARGYDLKPDGALVDPYAAHAPSGVPTDLFGLPFGDGLFAGTAAGVGLFLDGLFVRGTVLQPATVDMMTTTSPQAAAAEVPDPDLTTYALGTYRVGTDEVSGTWQGHRGTYAGFTTVGASEPATGTTLVVLTNVYGPQHAGRAIWKALAQDLEGVRGADAAG
jgi:CubicO group peptidase (beta-lactamase class C family)